MKKRCRANPRTHVHPDVAARIRHLLAAEIDRTTKTAVAEKINRGNNEVDLILQPDRPMRDRTADLVVTRMWGPHLWHHDPVLAQWYDDKREAAA